MTAAASDREAARTIAAVAGGHVAPLMADVERLLAGASAGAGPRLGPHVRTTVSAGGKRLRPLLAIVAAGAAADGGAADGIVRAAASVELLHTATLVHDDVIDDATLRRGAPTVYAQAGREAAIATGDYLFAHAFSLLVRNRSAAQLEVLAAAGAELADGELLQRIEAWDPTVDEARYEARCALKTAPLFVAACGLGSLHAGESADALAEYGRRIGLAFQILDDCLDLEGPAERIGKNRGTDLLDGTVTLPLILARRVDPALAALDLRAIADPAAAEGVCDRVIASGATAAARDRALAEVAAAKDAIPGGDERRRHTLCLIADSVVERFL